MLWPPEVTSVVQLPNDLAVAIEHGVHIVWWEQNLPKHEVPPEWMWPFPEELELWWQDVEVAREEERQGGSGNDNDGLVDNELAPPARRR